MPSTRGLQLIGPFTLLVGLVTAIAIPTHGQTPAVSESNDAPTAPMLPTLTLPGLSRDSLDLPPRLWQAVRDRVDAENRTIGYDAEEMGNFGRSTFLLPSVLRLFRDARTLPRFSGKVSDEFLDGAEKIGDFGYGWSDGGMGETARRGYRLLDVSTGRRVEPDTLDAKSVPFLLDPSSKEAWQELPTEIQELLLRLYRGAELAGPWVRAAFDHDLLMEITNESDLESIRQQDLYSVAMAHRDEESFDQLASMTPETFRLLETIDLAYLGYASVLYLRYVEFALQAFHESSGTAGSDMPEIESFRIATPLGEIVIGGTGNDDHDQPGFLTLDLGGDDHYLPGFGAPKTLGSPVDLILDLSGSDHYVDPTALDSTDAPVVPSFGAGIFGIGVLCDLAGDDEYVVRESGLGRGCFGTGMLVDFEGDDRYFSTGRWTQGAAHAGMGGLIDLQGNDIYSCAQQSQGLGATKGTGLLLDLTGDDSYTARDDGNISELYLGQSVAMSQGCGYGRRADLGDGHSLAGGFGLLIDGAGSDDYHAQVWSQGCGYWWGVGILEDRGGNDRYRNGKYSSGAAAHFAIGLHVDLSGDDEYNLDNDTAKNQFQGHARDGSVGIFIDGAGDDQYEFRSHCAGSGDLGSIGLFWDRFGMDRYVYDLSALGEGDWAETPPLGSTTRYDLFRSFRDDLPVYGLFLDTDGEDRYETAGVGANGRSWSMRRNRNAWGLGLDFDCYPPESRE